MKVTKEQIEAAMTSTDEMLESTGGQIPSAGWRFSEIHQVVLAMALRERDAELEKVRAVIEMLLDYDDVRSTDRDPHEYEGMYEALIVAAKQATKEVPHRDLMRACVILAELCREQHCLIEQVRDWRGLDGDGISDPLRAKLLAVLKLFEEVKSDVNE